jgi:hypothetical protein
MSDNADKTDTLRQIAYAIGYEKGRRNADAQHLWGGRITRKGEAEANARAFLKAKDEGEASDFFGGLALPEGYDREAYELTAREVSKAFLAEACAESSDEAVSDAIQEEFMMAYEDGLADELERDAREFLECL